MRYKEIEKRLKKDGWMLFAQRGSHCQFVHKTKTGKVTVPKHPGDINPSVVKSIWRQAGISETKVK